ncbi:MAG: YdiY family protein [Phycisphaerales bacterium]
MGTTRSLSLVVGLLLSAVVCAADDAPTPTHAIVLDTGETLRGMLVEKTDEHVVFDHPLLGRVTLPAGRVVSVGTIPPPADGSAAARGSVPPVSATESSTASTPPAPAEAPAPAAPPPPEAEAPKWSGKLEAGLNGSEGNTEQLSFRIGASVERKTDKDVFTASANYRLKTENGDRTQNELFLKERFEWLLPPTPWSVFIESNQEYNEFRDYDFRVDALVGVGYRFIDDEKTKLIGRVGVGAAKEFGGIDDDVYPTALASLEFSHQITERIAFSAYGEYKPDLSDFENYQLLGRASFDIALNESKSLFLKLGIEDRYDNDPGTAEANDIDYFASIVYAF